MTCTEMQTSLDLVFAGIAILACWTLAGSFIILMNLDKLMKRRVAVDIHVAPSLQGGGAEIEIDLRQPHEAIH